MEGQPGRRASSPMAIGLVISSMPPSAPRSTMPASMPGSGRPMEPGFTPSAAKLAIMMPPVSVCHQLSWNGLPKVLLLHTTASGFSGSPTLARKHRLERSNFPATSAPARISMRIAVGAEYHTVTLWSWMIPYQRSTSNSASSTIMVQPLVSGAMIP